ncbi:tRNA pseudouridine(38-40) synthase TruA [Synergistaceae bacterium OttesenSCG-928-I11]|nr:tRNA pseudouridine(38-40) synthase TruA [Synergistaceae bacterium OttesenSCG-928-I11]
MPRFAVTLSYDGTHFKGWQSQPGGTGVQDAVESALAELGSAALVTGAGRTDAGVHARGQVAHFDLLKEWAPRRLTLALNAKLPPSISVMRTARVDSAFHARRSAVMREYRYFIWNASTCYPHIKPYVLWLPGRHYNWSRASAAARLLVGEHDFRAFCRTVDCPEETRRTVVHARVYARKNFVLFRVVANGYLTNMIRIAVGNLMSVASGRRDENWFRSLLEGDVERAASGQTASPSGLFFWKATYSEPIAWE